MDKPTVNTSIEEAQTNADARREKGEFVRGVSKFRNVLGSDPEFPAEPGRYHLFVALNCPWCHRVTLARSESVPKILKARTIGNLRLTVRRR
jgi:putative glutathione S-transferase